MRAIIAARQGGKTTRMIEEMRKEPRAVMIVRSHHMKDLLAKEYPDIAKRLYTLDDFPTHSRGRTLPDDPIYLDDADDFLRLHFGNVQIVSMTREGER
jgi:hypothetical protein